MAVLPPGLMPGWSHGAGAIAGMGFLGPCGSRVLGVRGPERLVGAAAEDVGGWWWRQA
jgi:hypothetical protein